MKKDVLITLICYISTYGILGAEAQLLQIATPQLADIGVLALKPFVPCLVLNAVVACIHLLADRHILRRQRFSNQNAASSTL